MSIYIHSYDCVGGGGADTAVCVAAGREGLSFEQSYTQGDDLTVPSYPLHSSVEEQLRTWLASHPLRRPLAHHDRLVQLGCFAARNLTVPTDYGVVAGTSRGVSQELLSSYQRYFAGSPLSARVSPVTTGSALAAALGQVYGLSGMATGVSAACSSGLHAFGVAASLIETGALPGALVVAAESCLDPFTIKALLAARVHSRHAGYKPFSPHRSGLALGEGAAAVLLSPTPPPEGQEVIRLVAFASCREDATMTGITPAADGLQRAIRQVLQKSKLRPEQINLIIGHGAGTSRGDDAELACYAAVFGESLPAIQHYKWLMGHTLGATGLQAIAIAIENWRKSCFFPAPYTQKNILKQIPDAMPRYILACSLGFGGICSAVILERMTDIR